MWGQHSPVFLSHGLPFSVSADGSWGCVFTAASASHTCWRGLYHAIISGIRESVAVGTSRKQSSPHTSPSHTVCNGCSGRGESDGCVEGCRKRRKRVVVRKKEKPEEEFTSLHTILIKHIRLTEIYRLPLYYDNLDDCTYYLSQKCIGLVMISDGLYDHLAFMLCILFWSMAGKLCELHNIYKSGLLLKVSLRLNNT